MNTPTKCQKCGAEVWMSHHNETVWFCGSSEVEQSSEGLAKVVRACVDRTSMEIEIEQHPAVAQHVAKCFASMVAASPNYTEMKFELHGDWKGKGDWITVTIKKGKGKTPHECRMEAEQERDQLAERVKRLEEAGDAIVENGSASEGLVDAWRKAKEAKP